tara:strand:- start:507 stop:806 length:300 start_codon:yes stop_codon:yes gene_type:complete
MNLDKVIDLVFSELKKAEAKHPSWPEDFIHGAAIVAEEAGELVQASLDHVYEEGDRLEEMRTEAAQVAAMGIRFLTNLFITEDLLKEIFGEKGDKTNGE